MEGVVFADKLLEMCQQYTDDIAEQWYQSISTNPRTPSFHSLPKGDLILLAISIYRHLKPIYFSANISKEVTKYLNNARYFKDLFTKGIPLSEIIYAIILMRRHIWLYAEMQAMFYNTPADIYQQTESINRTLLIFDYLLYHSTQAFSDSGSRIMEKQPAY